MKLTDLFQLPEEEPMLELKVQFLNINAGYNEILKENCKILNEYTIFVEKIRNKINRKGMIVQKAVEETVAECIREDILRDFLIANRKEVIYMSIFEYDEEKELRLLREAEYQAGLADGREEGWKEGQKEGQKEGWKEGQKEGRKEGRAYAIIDLLSSLGTVSDTLKSRLLSISDIAVLNELIRKAATATSLEQFTEIASLSLPEKK